MISAKILIVDDESKIRRILQLVLLEDGYSIDLAENGQEAWLLFQQTEYDLVITDLKMPTLGGTKLLQLIQEKNLEVPVVVITAYGSIESAVKTMRQGAYDYITKPFDNDEIRLTIAKALDYSCLKKENHTLKAEIQARYDVNEFIGESEEIREIKEQALMVAKTSSTVLIQGDSGTGKELIARMVHFNSQRASQPFISVNCGALQDTLLESELFGYEKGAFTGALKKKQGKFELAHRGTIFLDEIGDMSQSLQVKVLRVLENKKFERVGGNETITTDTRIIAATNKNLKQMIQEGTFRLDLYYRLNIYPISTIPLREHQSDIVLLVDSFLSRLAKEIGKSVPEVSTSSINLLLAHNWPGNTRELKNCLERALILCKNNTIEPHHFALESDVANGPLSFLDIPIPAAGISLEEVEKTLIKKALLITEGNRSKAAKLLKLSRSTLRYRLEKYQLDFAG